MSGALRTLALPSGQVVSGEVLCAEGCGDVLLPSQVFGVAAKADRLLMRAAGFAKAAGLGCCQKCYMRVRRAASRTGFEDAEPVWRVCEGGCERSLVPQRTWLATPLGERREMLADGFVGALTSTMCKACRKRSRRVPLEVPA